MKTLEEKIRVEGTVRPGNVLKVDAFLNHQCDVTLYDEMGTEGYDLDSLAIIESMNPATSTITFR